MTPSTVVQTPPPLAGHTADVIDFKLFGEDMPFVGIELDPGESAIAEAGAMMCKSPAIQMETVFGDGSAQSQQGGGHEEGSILGGLGDWLDGDNR